MQTKGCKKGMLAIYKDKINVFFLLSPILRTQEQEIAPVFFYNIFSKMLVNVFFFEPKLIYLPLKIKL